VAATTTIRDDPQILITLLGPDGGDWPTAAEEVDFLIPRRVARVTGGRQLNAIAFDWALERSGDRLVDAVTPTGYNRIVDVHAYSPDTGKTRRLCWGKLGEQSHYLSDSTEAVRPAARIEPWLIGEEKTNGHFVSAFGIRTYRVDQPIVFNPEWDHRIVGNRSTKTVAGVNWWSQPESARTPTSRLLQLAHSQRWTLPQVVHTLCRMLNPLETYVRNPDLGDLESVLVADDVDADELVRNVSIDSDLWLSECLDQVLEPLGFGWYLEFDDDVATTGIDKLHTAFKFYALGSGDRRTVFLQRPGTEAISREKTNVADYHANLSISELANQIEGFTSPLVVESSFLLHPVWPEANDADDLDDLNKPDERSSGTVYRKFVLNEDGGINSVRTTPTTATDLDSLLTEPHPADGTRILLNTRRRFLPALSEGLDRGTLADNTYTDRELIGENGFLLEYQRRYDDTVGANQTDDWIEPDWPFAVLKDECGIRLTGAIPPELHTQLQAYPNDPPLRLTCSIESDFARHKIAAKQASSPQADTVRSIIDLSSRFHVRRVDTTSTLYADRHPAIASVNAPANAFILASAPVVPLQEGDRIAVTGSTGNDGLYTVSFVSVGAVNVVEEIPDATADGNLALFTREIDDTRELAAYLEHVRSWDDSADLAVSVTLDAIDHTEYKLSNLITSVEGRNLSLDANSPSAATARFPQIVGISYELQGPTQRTELNLESFKLERFSFEREA
jgi:hypothetical protein